jgi:iron complex outermembrane receptor protein
VNLFDTTQSIIVATPQLLTDLGANSPLDSLAYFAGVSRNAVSAPQQRMSFRGYQVGSAGTTDGLSFSLSGVGAMSQESALIDRMEVVMGVDSILSPAGIPGGILNIVTKKPKFENFGSITVQAGEYNANQAAIDVNQLVSKHLAIRAITSGVINNYYAVGYVHGFDQMLEASWRFANGSVVTLQNHYNWTHTAWSQGVMIDPSSGTLNYATMLPGLSVDAAERYQSIGYIKGGENATVLFFSGRINDNISTHLVAGAVTLFGANMSLTPGGSLGGGYNPLTGNWTPGFTYGPAPTFTPIPAQFSPIFSDSIMLTTDAQPGRAYEFQNDYAFNFDLGAFRSDTTVGVDATLARSVTFNKSFTVPSFNIFTGEPVPTLTGPGTTIGWTSNVSQSANFYVNELAKFFKDRLIINLGVAKDWNYIRTSNNAHALPYSVHPAPLFKNYGLVFKAVPNLALYYGHAESAAPQNTGVVNPPVSNLDLTSAKQDEGGVRMKILNGKGVATITYYQIVQNNYPILNQLNYTVPPPNPLYPNLYMDRVARGWEYQVNAVVTSELSVLLSYTNFKNRDPNGIVIRGSAENSGAAWIHYEKNQGFMKGFGLGVGYIHQGKSPGDTATGLTAATTPTHKIPNQPSFYIPSSAIVNAMMSYEWGGHWKISAFLDNALDREYIQASTRRTTVYPGTPANPRAMVIYSF